MKQYLKNLLIGLDQMLTVLIGGWPDETLSSYAYRLDLQGKRGGLLFRSVIDWIFLKLFRQDKHCYRAYRAERNRSQLPPELR